MGNRPSWSGKNRRNRRWREQQRYAGGVDEITAMPVVKRFLRKNWKGREIDVRDSASREWPSYFEMGGVASPWKPPT